MSEEKIVSANKELTTLEVLGILKNTFSEFERKDVIDLYRMAGPNYINDTVHNMLTGRALHLVQCMYKKGAMKEEINNGLEYLLVCIDAKKFNLDVSKCFDELKIKELLDKYDDKFSIAGVPERIEKSRKAQIELAEQKRTALELYTKDGFSIKDIAEKMNIPEVRVLNWVKEYRAQDGYVKKPEQGVSNEAPDFIFGGLIMKTRLDELVDMFKKSEVRLLA